MKILLSILLLMPIYSFAGNYNVYNLYGLTINIGDIISLTKGSFKSGDYASVKDSHMKYLGAAYNGKKFFVTEIFDNSEGHTAMKVNDTNGNYLYVEIYKAIKQKEILEPDSIYLAFNSNKEHKGGNNIFPNPFEFQKIDTVTGKKNDLYIKARAWVARTFVSAKDVIEMDDKDAGKIIGKATIEYTMDGFLNYTEHYIKFAFEIDLKDYKYRVRLYDYDDDAFVHSDRIAEFELGSLNQERVPIGFSGNAKWLNVKSFAYSKSIEMIGSLKEVMSATDSDKW